MSRWKIAAINFDHFHMGDNLRMAMEHVDVEIVALCDQRPETVQATVQQLELGSIPLFADYRACLEQTKPDVVLLCPKAAEHGIWTRNVAEYGVHVLIEKPFAASLAEADSMMDAMNQGGGRLAINWPMAWYPTHRTAARLIDQGSIGDVREVHYYDGNRGPLWHTAGKEERTAEQVTAEKPQSWFYSKAQGGGSLLDYLGYGATLATWFNGGQKPLEVSCMVDRPAGLEVDEHSIAIVRYEAGLSKLETRWGTFTDPWTYQPQPKCGFVIVGSAGTISCYDFESTIRVQDSKSPEGRLHPIDDVPSPFQNPVQYLLDRLEKDLPIEGPLSPKVSRVGQVIVDAAVQSAEENRAITLQ